MKDAMGDDPCFSRSRSGDDEKGAANILHCLFLAMVKSLKVLHSTYTIQPTTSNQQQN
jgi:hypothetical protein